MQSLEIWHGGSTSSLDDSCKISSRCCSQCCSFCRSYAQKSQFYSILQHINSIKSQLFKTQSLEIWHKGSTCAFDCACKISSRCCSYCRKQPLKAILQHFTAYLQHKIKDRHNQVLKFGTEVNPLQIVRAKFKVKAAVFAGASFKTVNFTTFYSISTA